LGHRRCQKVIALDYKIPVPACVQKAIEEYRAQNDWFGHFLEDKCEVDASFRKAPGPCIRRTAITASTQTNMSAARQISTLRWRTPALSEFNPRGKRFFIGLRLKTDDGDFDEFLK
jgi:putative DNA primase/helicase